MFNIIKTPRNYLYTRIILHDSNVAFHCKKSLAAILGGKLFEEVVFYRPSTALPLCPKPLRYKNDRAVTPCQTSQN